MIAQRSTRDFAILVLLFLVAFAGVAIGFHLDGDAEGEPPPVEWRATAWVGLLALPFSYALVAAWPKLLHRKEIPRARWGLVEAFLCFGFYWALAVALMILSVALANELGLSEARTHALLDLVQAASGVGGMAFLFVLVARRQGEVVRPLGLDRSGALGAALVAALGWLLFLPSFFFAGALVQLLHALAGEAPRVQAALVEVQSMRETGVDPVLLGALVLSANVVAPFVEEILFRGVFYGALRSRLGAVPAMGFSAAIFMVVHQPLAVWPQIFLLGLFLAWAYERSGSLAAPIAIHFANNAAVMGYAIGDALLGTSPG